MTSLRTSLLLFGLLNVGMGIHGAIQGSMVSLAAAGGAGLLAIVGALVAKNKPSIGFGIGAVVCVALLGNFVPKLVKQFTIYPAGVAAGAAALMLFMLAYGHFASRRES